MLTVIAVMGTLAGALLTGALQYFAQRAQRKAQEAAERRSAGMDAVAALCAALADHRGAMWDAGLCQVTGRHSAQAGERVRGTRSAVTGPLVRVSLLSPSAAPVARRAAEAVYAMREATTTRELEAARAAAVRAETELVDAVHSTLTK
ncbi:hypothetical protein [Streptomyces sp. DSM 41269]|uniref:hypothetical protein n=1 Tax=Streptomyces sp. DSM 41269 TaxID=2817709 RepID=UPI0005BA5DDE|nr:hypothetical protein [Streptomyces sp. DSM 41269]